MKDIPLNYNNNNNNNNNSWRSKEERVDIEIEYSFAFARFRTEFDIFRGELENFIRNTLPRLGNMRPVLMGEFKQGLGGQQPPKGPGSGTPPAPGLVGE